MSKRIILPCYDPYPNEEWEVIFDHAADVWAVILNVNSGVGSALDPGYVAMAQRLRAAGVKCLGYVSTRYGERPIGEVQREIGLWFAWYQVEGIFADEQSSFPSKLPYYNRIKNACGSAILVTNPGITPDAAYADLEAIICVAETDQETYLEKAFLPWTNKKTTLHIVYGVTDAARVLAKIDANAADFVYLATTIKEPGSQGPEFNIPDTIWQPTESTPTPAEDPNWAVIALQDVAVVLQAPAGSTLGDVPGLAQQRMSELVQLRANASSVIGIATNSELLAEVGKRMAHPAYA